jgi:hypothetical protein
LDCITFSFYPNHLWNANFDKSQVCLSYCFNLYQKHHHINFRGNFFHRTDFENYQLQVLRRQVERYKRFGFQFKIWNFLSLQKAIKFNQQVISFQPSFVIADPRGNDSSLQVLYLILKLNHIISSLQLIDSSSFDDLYETPNFQNETLVDKNPNLEWSVCFDYYWVLCIVLLVLNSQL